jgi:hypothetical protein
MRPEKYGALDGRIREALHKEGRLPRIFDGVHNSMVSGYIEFVKLLEEIKAHLHSERISKPICHLSGGEGWRACEIEMALFSWAGKKEKR